MNDPRGAAGPNWLSFRQLMPVTAKWAYFDNAAVAPLPTPTRAAITEWLREAVDEGDTVWSGWSRRVEQTRNTAARLINADPHEIALVPNTTAGITLVAEGLPWRAGDNVVTLADEFPSNVYPWMNLQSRGVELRRVPAEEGVDLNRLAEACDARTRVVSVSWVGFASGWRLDVEQFVQLAHQRGALAFLDAIQGLGVFPLDVRATGVDFLAADGHKWMLGPEGAGIFYLRREHLPLLRPLGVGWNSVAHAGDYGRIEWNLRADAARYEGGSQNMAGLLGLGASLDTLAQFGLGPATSAIADRVLEITDYACRRLADVGARIASCREGAHRSGIVAFDLPGREPDELRRRCLAAGVVLSCRGGHLRISPHAYAHEDDVERMIEVVR